MENLKKSNNIKDSVLLVTGANRKKGIGNAIVHEAIKRGAKKVYATSRDISQLEDLAAQYNGIVIPLELDVTNKEQVHQVSKRAKDTQILINNSGVCGFSGFCFNYNENIARRELEVNYFGPLNLTRSFVNHFIENKKGVIVNIVSIGGLSAFPLTASYSASKAAAHSLTQSIRAELSLYDIPVFGVYPGPIDTEMAECVQLEKETPKNTAIRIFDGIESGIEDITPDKFSIEFLKELSENSKSVEKNVSDYYKLVISKNIPYMKK